MAEMELIKTRLVAGVWEGVLTASGRTPPHLRVTHQDTVLPGVEVTALTETGEWLLRVPVPAALISDGVQTFVIVEQESGEKLESFSIVAGDALADDLRVEIDLLRAELDMLKRAFRRHCVETGGA